MKKGTIIAIVTTSLVGAFATATIAGNLFKDEQSVGDKKSGWVTTNQKEDELNKDNQEQKAEQKIEGKTEVKKTNSKTNSKIKGIYRCWSFNVAGSGQKCTSPSIVLNADGTYSMSSEKGTYKISGDQIILSESKIRGPGTFKEGQKQIVFNYTYNGKATTVTYLNYDDPENNKGKMVSVKLNVIFPEGDDRAKWLSSISLAPNEGPEVYDALAQNEGEHKIVAEYREVESGKKYKVMAGPSEAVGEVDLTGAKGHAEFTVYVNGAKEEVTQTQTPTPAPAPKPKPKPAPAPAPAPTPTPTPTPAPAPAPTPTPTPAPEPEPYVAPTPAPEPEPSYVAPTPEPAPESSPYAGKPCDPNIPHYSQPGCVD